MLEYICRTLRKRRVYKASLWNSYAVRLSLSYLQHRIRLNAKEARTYECKKAGDGFSRLQWSEWLAARFISDFQGESWRLKRKPIFEIQLRLFAYAKQQNAVTTIKWFLEMRCSSRVESEELPVYLVTLYSVKTY